MSKEANVDWWPAEPIAAGLMRIGELSDQRIRDIYEAAREAGITVFDHADIYGSFIDGGYLHLCEERFGAVVDLRGSEREEISIQTKAGIRPGLGYDSSYEHLVFSAEESLRALQTDYIDVFLIHRPDALVEPEEVARAFDDLETSGKVRHFGVSNHTPAQIELLRTAVDQPLILNQIQLSLVHAGPIAQGITANTGADAAASRELGVLDFARASGMAIQAWSPVQGPEGPFIDSPAYPELNSKLGELAAKYGTTPSAIAYAWLWRYPAKIQGVVGTTRPERIGELAGLERIELTREEWYGLYQAAGHPLP